MNAAKPPPPPPQRPGASRPPTPPPPRVGTSTSPPASGGSAAAPPLISTRPTPLARSRPPSPPAMPGLPARLRVSVKASVRDANLFLARPLAEGAEPPPGTREAFLVLPDAEIEVEPDADAPNASNGGQGP